MKKMIHVLIRGVSIILALAIVLVVVVLAIDAQVSSVGQNRLVTLEDAPVADCVIVPGAQVLANGTPSQMLQDRLDVALLYYNSGRTDRILVSGDNGQVEYNEVIVMRNYLLAHGVPIEVIFMDHAGFDTYDTMYRARDIFLVDKAVVVTQEFHLLRALYIGQELGLEVHGVASDPRPYAGADYYRLREYLARFKAFLDCQFNSKPTYLGETIPITGDGRATLG
ncbi:MAG: ElyC/SanA/YdcF family protein [Eubacteriales bacterium]|nr:ElyC/SanA/YdcF family protein [Eubacteriales bacterium]